MDLPPGIIFDESYVLSIRIEPYTVSLSMDFCLMEGHPLYSHNMRPNQSYFRNGTITISEFKGIEWSATGHLPAVDANGETDFGCLDEISEIQEI